MAYWRIPFKTFLGKNLEVIIGGAPSDVTLTGAANPFNTQEDTSDSVFTPIRRQTGYVRFIDTTGSTWQDILPTEANDRPVSLVDNDNQVVLWRGYIKPQAFSITMKEAPMEVELPVMCQLSVLDYYDVEDIDSAKGTVLYTMMKMLYTASNEWDDLYVSNNRQYDYAGTDSWLAKDLPALLIWENFFEVAESVRKPRFSRLDVLEGLCKLFGWTCRTDGGKVYFISADGQQNARRYIWHTDLRGITENTLTPLSNSWCTWSTLSSAEQVFPFGENAPIAPEFISTKQTIKIVQGKREVTVRGDVNSRSMSLDPHEGDMLERLYGNMRQNTKYQISVTQTNIPVASGVSSNYFVWRCKNEVLTSPQTFDDGTVITFPSMSNVGLFRIAKSGEVVNNFNFEFGFRTENFQYITIENPYFYLNDNAVDIVVNASYRRAYVVPSDDAPTDRSKDELVDDTYQRLDFKMRVGDKWLQLDGTWGDTEPTPFIIESGNNRDLYSEAEEYDGHGYHVTDAIRNKRGILLKINASPGWTQRNWVVELNGVSIEVATRRQDSKKAQHEAKVVNNSAFRDTLSISSIFTPATEFVNGLGCVTCRSDAHTVLAQRAAAFYSKRRRILKIESRPTQTYNTPTPLKTAYGNGFQAYPLSISREWRDDKYTTIYIETT